MIWVVCSYKDSTLLQSWGSGLFELRETDVFLMEPPSPDMARTLTQASEEAVVDGGSSRNFILNCPYICG
jgi:hypothetical protein